VTPHSCKAVTRPRAPDLRRFVEGPGYNFVSETIKTTVRSSRPQTYCDVMYKSHLCVIH